MAANNVMVDIESLGSRPGSVILSVGACKFDPETDAIASDTFYTNIRLQPQLEAGLTVDGDTIRWWFGQSDKAIKSLLASPVHFPREAISQFYKWYEGSAFVWSHGSNFDTVLLDSFFRAFGKERCPWPYRNIRDTRTLFALVPGYYDVNRAGLDQFGMPKNLIAHNALDDAIEQAKWVQHAYYLLREAMARPMA